MLTQPNTCTEQTAPKPVEWWLRGTRWCPVDVASGRMFTAPQLELALPGPLPLVIQRSYTSHANKRDVGLGYGWSHTLAWEVVVGRRVLRVWTERGTWVDFPRMKPGESRQGRWGWVLSCDDWGYRLDDDSGVVRELYQVVGNRWLLSRLVDRNGNAIVLRYLGNALASVRDSVGRTVRLERDEVGDGRITALQVRNRLVQGSWVTFARYRYDTTGRLITASDADGHRNHYTYDAEQRMTQQIYKAGSVFRYRYDSSGRCIASYGHRPDGVDPSLAADLASELSNGEPASGVHSICVDYHSDGYREVHDSTRTTRYHTNEHGLLDLEDIGDRLRSAAFCKAGFLLSETDAAGGATRYTRDSRGRLLTVVDPLGRTTRIERNRQGDITALIDAAGGTTTLERDGRGNLQMVIQPDGGAVTCEYDARGMLTSIVDTQGGRTHFVYDDEHLNLTLLCLANGGEFHYQYDDLGRLLTSTDPLGHQTHYAYSVAGKLLVKADRLGRTCYCYNGDGYLTEVISPKGGRTCLAWGGLHKLVQRTDANGATVTLRYNHEGELLEMANQRGGVHRIERDMAGDIIGEVLLDGGRRHYRNDDMGRRVRIDDETRGTTSLTYDPVGQLLRRQLPDGSEERFRYDALGALLEAVNAGCQVRFERDQLGRVVREVQSVEGRQHWVESSYDLEGRRMRRKTSLGYEERIQRNAIGAVVGLNLAGAPLRRRLDALGQEPRRTLPHDGEICSEMDALGRVVRRVATLAWAVPSPRVVADEQYDYDVDGQWVRKHAGAKLPYEYNLAGRLLAAGVERFDGDELGRRYKQGIEATFDEAHRLLTHGDWRYTYDEVGRLLERRDDNGQRWRYQWDAAGLLQRVQRPDGAEVRYRYDAFGRRLQKRLFELGKGGALGEVARTRFVWDGELLVHEQRVAVREPHVRERTYVFADDGHEPVAQRTDDGPWRFFLNDPSGAPDKLLDDCGRVVCTLQRDARGRTQQSGEADTPLRHQGGYEDAETGLHYQRHRYYDPESGRFLDAGVSLPQRRGPPAGGPRYRHHNRHPGAIIHPIVEILLGPR